MSSGLPKALGLALLTGVAAIAASCGVDTGGEEIIRAATTVDYVSQETTLVFRPGTTDLDSGTQTVEFEIATDDWIQHVSLYDTYVVTGSTLVPAPDAVLQNYTLSDEGPFGGMFQVSFGALEVGELRVELTVPVSLEPQPRHADHLRPEDTTFTIALVYLVWTEVPDADPGFPTKEELVASAISDARTFGEFLGCPAEGSFHHGSPQNAEDALRMAIDFVRDNGSMQGHKEFVEALPVATGLWAIIDSDGYVVGSVEKDQTISICTNEPPGYTPPTVGEPFPPCEGPDEKSDPDCQN